MGKTTMKSKRWHTLKDRLKPFIRRVLYYLPVCRNKIVFLNYDGKGYGDNSKYIAEEILRRNLPYKLVWLVSRNNAYVPNTLRKAGLLGNRGFYELSTAKVIVNNCKSNLPPDFRKKKNQFYLQTWHGDFALKFIEKEIETVLSATYLAHTKADSAMTDAVVTGSRSFSTIVKESFWLPEKCAILEFGVPRNDLYFQGEAFKANLRKRMGFSEGERILLYAPTFRDKGETDCYNLDFESVRDVLCQKTGDPWKIVIRLHPNITRQADRFRYDNSILNGSVYPDQQELCMISDCLITDYSSIMGDFMLMRKPVFLYVPDLERYAGRNTGRGLRDLFYNLPMSFCRTQEELEAQIAGFDRESFTRDEEAYLQEHYQSIDDGHASERVVDYLLHIR